MFEHNFAPIDRQFCLDQQTVHPLMFVNSGGSWKFSMGWQRGVRTFWQGGVGLSGGGGGLGKVLSFRNVNKRKWGTGNFYNCINTHH